MAHVRSIASSEEVWEEWPQDARGRERGSTRGWLTGLAAAAIHAPALIAAGSTALSVAAQRINNPRAGSGEQGEAEEDEDSDDMVIMADGSSVSLYEHVERVRR